MPWAYQFDASALRALKKLGSQAQKQILGYIDARLIGEGNPRRFGKALTGDLRGLWRWRVGDYRILGRVQDEKLLILVVEVGHRKEVYD
ncbi:MAG: type II toxin-antitoxin system RelE/ParE family toxin [Puniceicoccales bacterium]|nr:type II toxin-antitoxin system RelE/ParE family toxin [Puniceicoccales bacterium]